MKRSTDATNVDNTSLFTVEKYTEESVIYWKRKNSKENSDSGYHIRVRLVRASFSDLSLVQYSKLTTT
ncbi:hypothetical protein BpHYR1_004151 [Brachionus plicatilis]|uniref:Uncharacterized protein n=1 Tax=Brachionus plicatilis TaxID=10195 RepID=A0A3M7SXQ1_BRAPC|nr:hypothetical protein BpHYR1_004151 [Brachionus plicatilis]